MYFYQKPKKKSGRKPKPKSKKESEIIVIKVTPDELRILDEKRGLTPRATYMKFIIRNETDLLK